MILRKLRTKTWCLLPGEWAGGVEEGGYARIGVVRQFEVDACKKLGVLSAGTGNNEAEVGAGYFNGDVHGLIQW